MTKILPFESWICESASWLNVGSVEDPSSRCGRNTFFKEPSRTLSHGGVFLNNTNDHEIVSCVRIVHIVRIYGSMTIAHNIFGL